jgi:hypothetical protein
MPKYQCLWFQLYRASNFYCMAIATEPSSPSGLPSAADCWVRVSFAVALEMSLTAATAAVADTIITAADAVAINPADAAIAAPLDSMSKKR